ncbi:GM21547 [Drosophila sechellia]|uniref:GM21547 n=1 Tax=Drosophila sechellia TaxID=7238 RepID=B4HRD5_DROSE|nr:GM21547 [Drosophila sechellia]
MSRRKQAKPRACLKLGEKEDEENTGLLEPKEELLSGDEDNEDNEGEDEDEEVADEVAPEGGGGERPQLEPNESQQQSWPTADEPAAPAAVAKEEEAEEGSEELQHPRDEVVASDAAANANGHCKSSGPRPHLLAPPGHWALASGHVSPCPTGFGLFRCLYNDGLKVWNAPGWIRLITLKGSNRVLCGILE